MWFGVLGAATLGLGLPFALPVDRAVVDGDYPTLEDAATDTVLTWATWSPDLSELDARCTAPRMQPGMSSLYAECGSTVVHLAGSEGVDAGSSDGDLARAADRAVRSAWMADQEPMDFRPAEVSGLFHPDLASSVGRVLVSGTFEYGADDTEGWSPDDGLGDFGGLGGDLQDVGHSWSGPSGVAATVSGTARGGGTDGASLRPVATRSIYACAAAFTGPDRVMYTLVVSGGSPAQVESTLTDLLGGMR